ncbi:hypothetical protein LWI29_018891 [Acer saccharum]|uniref:Uncharacterized protein n=1 Tax=Acer saccharum TaxID=4024 RepID=A0AA39T468_ACESA|nr:hypothetical protein LWI29_018891 [Acer saccharum]
MRLDGDPRLGVAGICGDNAQAMMSGSLEVGIVEVEDAEVMLNGEWGEYRESPSNGESPPPAPLLLMRG